MEDPSRCIFNLHIECTCMEYFCSRRTFTYLKSAASTSAEQPYAGDSGVSKRCVISRVAKAGARRVGEYYDTIPACSRNLRASLCRAATCHMPTNSCGRRYVCGVCLCAPALIMQMLLRNMSCSTQQRLRRDKARGRGGIKRANPLCWWAGCFFALTTYDHQTHPSPGIFLIEKKKF